MKILDGKEARAHYLPILQERIKALSFTPCLVIIQVGNRPDSTAFIKAKRNLASKIGVKELHIQLDEKVSQYELITAIRKYNQDTEVHGIILQLPLPIHIDPESVIESIDPRKDVDGLTSYHMKRLIDGKESSIMTATARGIKQILQYYHISLFGKKVVVVGRSTLVGKPTALMCLNENATVTICHSKTVDLEKETKNADILIVAIGKPNFIDNRHLKKNQIVIDVGINKLDDGKIVGDVKHDSARELVAMITPVPGGVGQMTVLALFENLVDLCYSRNN